MWMMLIYLTVWYFTAAERVEKLKICEIPCKIKRWLCIMFGHTFSSHWLKRISSKVVTGEKTWWIKRCKTYWCQWTGKSRSNQHAEKRRKIREIKDLSRIFSHHFQDWNKKTHKRTELIWDNFLSTQNFSWQSYE